MPKSKNEPLELTEMDIQINALTEFLFTTESYLIDFLHEDKPLENVYETMMSDFNYCVFSYLAVIENPIYKWIAVQRVKSYMNLFLPGTRNPNKIKKENLEERVISVADENGKLLYSVNVSVKDQFLFEQALAELRFHMRSIMMDIEEDIERYMIGTTKGPKILGKKKVNLKRKTSKSPLSRDEIVYLFRLLNDKELFERNTQETIGNALEILIGTSGEQNRKAFNAPLKKNNLIKIHELLTDLTERLDIEINSSKF